MLITIQYLEGNPGLPRLDQKRVGDKLRNAFDLIPITHLLIGWNLPDYLLEVCRREANRAGARFYRWHPLLTGDSKVNPQLECQVVGLMGNIVPGFANLLEFTFACPNNAQAIDQIQNRISELIKSNVYHGFFLDRIRWPSPAANPLSNLGCFCPGCHEEAAKAGLNLTEIQKHLQNMASTAIGKMNLIRNLLVGKGEIQDGEFEDIQKWLAFRELCITRLVQRISTQLRLAGLEIGLDCFSPGLTRMVGQDLTALSSYADWMKVMTYAHTLGPAGVPYELLGFVDFLTSESGLSEQEALDNMAFWLKIPMPSDRHDLLVAGLNKGGLLKELHRALRAVKIPLLAGLELVEVPGVTCLDDAKIQLDHVAARNSGVDGVSISWDLQHIPFERLKLVSKIWSG